MHWVYVKSTEKSVALPPDPKQRLRLCTPPGAEWPLDPRLTFGVCHQGNSDIHRRCCNGAGSKGRTLEHSVNMTRIPSALKDWCQSANIEEYYCASTAIGQRSKRLMLVWRSSFNLVVQQAKNDFCFLPDVQFERRKLCRLFDVPK